MERKRKNRKRKVDIMSANYSFPFEEECGYEDYFML